MLIPVTRDNRFSPRHCPGKGEAEEGAVNHLSWERAQFERVYSAFLEKGGQLMYTRKKEGARTVAFFELKEKGRRAEAPGESLL